MCKSHPVEDLSTISAIPNNVQAPFHWKYTTHFRFLHLHCWPEDQSSRQEEAQLWGRWELFLPSSIHLLIHILRRTRIYISSDPPLIRPQELPLPSEREHPQAMFIQKHPANGPISQEQPSPPNSLPWWHHPSSPLSTLPFLSLSVPQA